jgi:hypothetical protein
VLMLLGCIQLLVKRRRSTDRSRRRRCYGASSTSGTPGVAAGKAPPGVHRSPRLTGRSVGSTGGMATLHPAGVHHGPQPGAAEGAAKKEMTDEVAVMVECQQPLTVSPEAEKASVEAYATSWARGLGLLEE